jgi:CRISPR-associated protein Cmr1
VALYLTSILHGCHPSSDYVRKAVFRTCDLDLERFYCQADLAQKQMTHTTESCMEVTSRESGSRRGQDHDKRLIRYGQVMGLRPPPNIECLSGKPQSKPFRCSLKFITPILGGGAKKGEPDPACPVRGTAIRGALRWWWRRVTTVPTDDLAREEAKLFGSPESPSPLVVCVRADGLEPDQIGIRNCGAPKYSYGLISGQIASTQCLRPFQFDLELNSQSPEIMEALWCLVHFGGLGGRTRRGFGALSSSAPQAPDLNDLFTGMRSRAIDRNFSGFKGSRLFITREPLQNAERAWEAGINLYEAFRKGNLPGSVGRKSSKQESHTRWPESNVLRHGAAMTAEAPLQGARPVPRADLGLPLELRSAPGAHSFRNRTVNYGPANEGGRWPSPVLIRPVKVEGGFKAIVLILGGPSPGIDQIGNPFTSLDCSAWPHEWFQSPGVFVKSRLTQDRARDKFAEYIKTLAAGGWQELP